MNLSYTLDRKSNRTILLVLAKVALMERLFLINWALIPFFVFNAFHSFEALEFSWGALATLTLGVLFFPSLLNGMRRRLRHLARPTAPSAYHKTWRAEVSETGLSAQTGAISHTWPWTAVRLFVEAKDCFAIYWDDLNCTLIPKTAFCDTLEEDEFIRLYGGEVIST